MIRRQNSEDQKAHAELYAGSEQLDLSGGAAGIYRPVQLTSCKQIMENDEALYLLCPGRGYSVAEVA